MTTFSSLSPEAQSRAIEHYRYHGLNYDWWDFIYDDFTTIAHLLGITLKSRSSIYFRLAYSQGDRASFDGSYEYEPTASLSIRTHCPHETELHEIADRLTMIGVNAALDPENPHTPSAKITSCRDTCISVDSETDGLYDVFKDLTNWLYDRLRDAYEDMTSDEAIIETLKVNEYEFTEEGELA